MLLFFFFHFAYCFKVHPLKLLWYVLVCHLFLFINNSLYEHAIFCSLLSKLLNICANYDFGYYIIYVIYTHSVSISAHTVMVCVCVYVLCGENQGHPFPPEQRSVGSAFVVLSALLGMRLQEQMFERHFS